MVRQYIYFGDTATMKSKRQQRRNSLSFCNKAILQNAVQSQKKKYKESFKGPQTATSSDYRLSFADNSKVHFTKPF